jgi:hypothetical protein
MTQKIASEPKPQARAAVAKAICRMCSMAPQSVKNLPGGGHSAAIQGAAPSQASVRRRSAVRH